MKILVTSDLHAHMPWFEWLARIGKDFDLIVLGGDLLQQETNILDQANDIFDWLKLWPESNGTLAICSGNHDFNDAGFAHHPDLRAFTSYRNILKPDWIGRAIIGLENVTGPGQIHSIKSEATFIIAATEYPHSTAGGASRTAQQLKRAHALTKEMDKLIIIHHSPPLPVYNDCTPEEVIWAKYIVDKFEPDYMFGGHLHSQPYTHGATFQIGKTLCANSGQLTPNEGNGLTPNFLTIDTVNGNIWWNYFTKKNIKA